MTDFESIAGVGRPARDALRAAGIANLEAMDGRGWEEMLALHGVGKRGLERLNAALQEQGMGLHGAPAPEDRSASFTRGHRGKNSEDMAGAMTGESVGDYLAGLEDKRRAHGELLLELFGSVTQAEPRMWGPTMVGYGEVHYRYATGREGDTFQVGFSPRKAKISLYGLPHDEDLLEHLGKHTVSKFCLYINKPEDVDLKVLEELIRRGWESAPASC